ncbi:MAG TPA: lysylphosphatidylglycerol synthase transmembrane domain-containing protein [Fibrobacteria bacterium]|nr:lysylphosphatidylglycerol synthase transmembrane domain-containing protein [Fibrobacteria bacterium]
MTTAAPKAAPGRRLPAWLAWVLRGAVLLSLLAYILHGLDFPKVGETLRKLPPPVFLIGIALLALGQLLQAARWKVLLRDPAIRYLDCLAFISMGASLNLVSPSGILSDGTVAYWMGRRNQAVMRSMSTLLASRFIGIFGMGLLFLAALPSHLWVFGKLTFAWAPAKALFLFAALGSLATLALLARRHQERVRRLVLQALPVLSSPRALLVSVVLSVAIQLCQFLMMLAGFRAMDIPVGVLDILFFAPIMTFLGMIPMSIGGIGVREGLSIFFFTLLPGVEKEHLLAHAGYGYVLLLGMAAVNISLAFAVLGRPGASS